MTEPEPPAAKPESQLTTPPRTPAMADALRALGPDYEQALVDSIAARVDELAQEREAKARGVAAPTAQPHPLQFPGAPRPLPVQTPAPPPAGQFPMPPPAQIPHPGPGPQPGPQHHHSGGPAMPISILSLVFGFVLTIIALTAGFSDGGPAALLAILIIWIALVLINFAAWGRRPGR